MSPTRSTTADREGAPAQLHPGAAFERVLIVANPIAGSGQGATAARELEAGLKRAGSSVELHLCSGRGDGRRRVRSMAPDIDLVVAVGGDGTLREVFDGLVDEQTVVALLPMGTANVLSLDLGLPRDVDGLLECIAQKRTTALDVADVNGSLSFLVTGIGFDGHVVHTLEARRSGPISKLDWCSALLRSLASYHPPRLRVEIDGEPLRPEYAWVLISNIEHYAGLVKLEQGGARADGHFDVHLYERGNLSALARLGLRGLFGTLPGRSGTLRRARRVKVHSESPVPCQVDGDARGHTPLEFQVLPLPRHLIVP